MENTMTPNSQSSLRPVAKLALIGALGTAAIYAARQRRRMDLPAGRFSFPVRRADWAWNWPALLRMRAPISCFWPATQTS